MHLRIPIAIAATIMISAACNQQTELKLPPPASKDAANPEGIYQTGNTHKAAMLGALLERAKFVQSAFIKEQPRTKIVHALIAVDAGVLWSVGAAKESAVIEWAKVIDKDYPDWGADISIVDKERGEIGTAKRGLPTLEQPNPEWTVDIKI